MFGRMHACGKREAPGKDASARHPGRMAGPQAQLAGRVPPPVQRLSTVHGRNACAQGIQEMSALGKPIYITETGIADRKGDKRPLWLQTYIPQVAFPPGPCPQPHLSLLSAA